MLGLEDIHVTAGAFALSADFSVSAGQSVAIIGPSGGGKSTLLDVIAGFRKPDRGRVLWQRHDLTALAPSERPMSILFQDGNLFPHLTIERNLALTLRPGSGRLRADDAGRIAAVLEQVGLAGYGPRRPGEMSGGQQGRAALARVLLQARPVLLLDEPFSALGPALKDEMLDLVIRICGDLEKTALLVTHDPKDARRFAETTILVDAGRAHPPQSTKALFDDPPAGLRAYLGETPG